MWLSYGVNVGVLQHSFLNFVVVNVAALLSLWFDGSCLLTVQKCSSDVFHLQLELQASQHKRKWT